VFTRSSKRPANF